MLLKTIQPAKSIPDDINVVIEIAANAPPVKYEVNKDHGMLEVDRIISTAMHYPCNYGFVPNTLAEDGDPVDVLVMTPFPLLPGCLVRVRALGMLQMEDESGLDNKLLAVPVVKLCPQFAHYHCYQDVPQTERDTIKHFFEHYKDLEKGKWVKVKDWLDVAAAKAELEAGIKRV